MTPKEHQANILQVIELAKEVAEEAPEALEHAALDFHVRTPMGIVRSGVLHLWLDNVPLATPLCDTELRQPVKDLHDTLTRLWLRGKLAKCEAEQGKATKALEVLIWEPRK